MNGLIGYERAFVDEPVHKQHDLSWPALPFSRFLTSLKNLYSPIDFHTVFVYGFKA